jgi:hypothetical protein
MKRKQLPSLSGLDGLSAYKLGQLHRAAWLQTFAGTLAIADAAQATLLAIDAELASAPADDLCDVATLMTLARERAGKSANSILNPDEYDTDCAALRQMLTNAIEGANDSRRKPVVRLLPALEQARAMVDAMPPAQDDNGKAALALQEILRPLIEPMCAAARVDPADLVSPGDLRRFRWRLARRARLVGVVEEGVWHD